VVNRERAEKLIESSSMGQTFAVIDRVGVLLAPSVAVRCPSVHIVRSVCGNVSGTVRA